MSQIKLKVNTVTQKYPILIGSNLISKLSKIFRDNSIQFKQCLLIVDKNIAALAQLTDHHYILDKGQIVWDGSSDALISDASLKARYLGV